jgi:hypothetical protein
MTATGRCHCGAIRYAVTGEPKHTVLCHCTDCQRSSGAPMVAWTAVAEGDFAVTQGNPKTINSSGASIRNFCPDCGTGLYFTNAENLPGIVDIQTATFDDPNAFAPQAQIQTADRLNWMEQAHALHAFERFPGG